MVVYTKDVQKTLNKLPQGLVRRIQSKLDTIAINPFAEHRNVKRLSGNHQYRLRVGDWRVLYEIENEQLIIFVVKVASRGGAYKK